MTNALSCRGLSKSYGKIGPWALNNVNLDLPSGQIVGLLGPNGSGKTTLLKLACGLLTPTGGTLLVGGAAPGLETKKRVSYLPDRNYLPSWMRTGDLLDYFGDFYTDFDRKKAEDMLKRLELDKKMQLKAMSKGTREKVQLVLVMSRAADLYLLDEPIGGVDPAARDYILDTIISNYREDATVVISTHLIADVEKVLDTVVFLNGGKIGLVSTTDAIRAEQGKSVDTLFREVYRC
ncbi:ABC transporter ATP-binding protein [Ruminococcaceae bacterium OttesenSCG-928-D13]|nr:ABC transporter ATP-binding protein [Ruminococcaceae bacterium OttesenSCG-928-D13]